MYLYELPTTGAVSFSEFCLDLSSDKRYTYWLQEATQSRANLRGILKESKHINHADKDNLRLIKIIEEYLPQLLGLMTCIAHNDIGLSSEPVFSWRATLSTGMFSSSSRLAVPSFTADLAFVLLTYAFALSNLAHSNVAALGSYERDRGISEVDRKSKDDQLGVAVSFLRRASGIFSYINETVLAGWDFGRAGNLPGTRKPPDLTQEVNNALSKMSLADAQSLAIRKLLSKAAFETNIAPGPPLPKSHPSPVLLAKLHLECASLYSSARSLIKNFGASKTVSDIHGEIQTDLRRYLTDEAAFHRALAKKWLAVDAGENGGTTKGGEAVAFMVWAKKELEDLKESGSAVILGKVDKEKRAQLKSRVALELEGVNSFYKHYKKLNDSLHFQPVPNQADVQRRIPVGRLAVEPQQFLPPTPAFIPSLTNIQKMEKFDNSKSTSQGELETSVKRLGTYAGAGAYF
ncbi:hypothetical protein AX17_003994 [Amanita inopinata Kibby_2008]|nr:hypothetical protein AX17_003994 [Amanita inopinata Kibby_2008]